MELKIRKNGEVYIIDVNGEMDLYNSYKLKELVLKMLEKNVKSFIINLEQVDYITSLICCSRRLISLISKGADCTISKVK